MDPITWITWTIIVTFQALNALSRVIQRRAASAKSHANAEVTRQWKHVQELLAKIIQLSSRNKVEACILLQKLMTEMIFLEQISSERFLSNEFRSLIHLEKFLVYGGACEDSIYLPKPCGIREAEVIKHILPKTWSFSTEQEQLRYKRERRFDATADERSALLKESLSRYAYPTKYNGVQFTAPEQLRAFGHCIAERDLGKTMYVHLFAGLRAYTEFEVAQHNLEFQMMNVIFDRASAKDVGEIAWERQLTEKLSHLDEQRRQAFRCGLRTGFIELHPTVISKGTKAAEMIHSSPFFSFILDLEKVKLFNDASDAIHKSSGLEGLSSVLDRRGVDAYPAMLLMYRHMQMEGLQFHAKKTIRSNISQLTAALEETVSEDISSLSENLAEIQRRLGVIHNRLGKKWAPDKVWKRVNNGKIPKQKDLANALGYVTPVSWLKTCLDAFIMQQVGIYQKRAEDASLRRLIEWLISQFREEAHLHPGIESNGTTAKEHMEKLLAIPALGSGEDKEE